MHHLAWTFNDPLVDLGGVEQPAFAGVLSPTPEVGQVREGVNSAFLEDAEEYYRRHQGFDYWRTMFSGAFRRLGISDARLVVEYGCGFGNSTLPLLDLLPSSEIVASDISPNLLAIAKRLVDARDLEERCLLAAMDAQKPYLKDSIADLVVGSAILHHLADPQAFIAAAVRVLKPGAPAIFFEPFELGYALIRMVLLDILSELESRGETCEAAEWMRQLTYALGLQIRRDENPGWRELDDKWVFPRSVLQRIADEVGAELIVYSIDPPTGKLRWQVAYMLTVDRGLPETALPSWAWERIERLDRDVFSTASSDDILIAGGVIFRKRLEPAAS